MTTVQSKVTDGQDLVPFFYLRITGLPFYIFATIDPSASSYGSFAWTAPAGFPSTWAQRGLELPNDTIDQKLPDLIGGVASAGRCRLSVIDFADPNHPSFGYFSRIFAPGRAFNDSTIASARLKNYVVATGADSVVVVSGQIGTFANPSDIYIGAETLGVAGDSDLGGGVHELTIAARNKYVCYGNSAAGPGGTYWPPIPYHRVIYDNSGAVQDAPRVLSDVPEVLGRTAALWMGHMRPDGNPEPETSSACLLLGRITGLEIGKVGGMFDITVESITQDLSKALVAPDLPTGTIQDGFYLQNSAWCSFAFLDTTPPTSVTITPGVYATAAALASQITTKVQASATAYQGTTCEIVIGDDGNNYFQFSAKGEFITLGAALPSPVLPQTSLLWALGFDSTAGGPFQAVDTTDGSGTNIVRATRPIARVFVPTYDGANANVLTIKERDVPSFFFSNQNDGTGYAWARFGDGQTVLVKGSSSTTVTTGQIGFFPVSSQPSDSVGRNQYYYVGQDGTATITQVIMHLSWGKIAPLCFTQYLAMLLASTTGHTADAILNVFPEGVGLGWFRLLTAADWLVSDEIAIDRMTVVDNTTKFMDLFQPYARLHGLFLVWDPSAGSIRLRRMHPPSKAGASSSGTTTVAFSESNRAKETDRTSQRQDRTSLRTSWKLQAGFSFHSFSPPSIVINDVRARSMYPNDARQEVIEDKTLIDIGAVGDTVRELVKLYGAPYTICSRSMNKRGMLLAPGTIHQVVDNTMVNPFTGASGITSSDTVYCFLTRAAMNPSTGDVTIEFVINSTEDQSLYRQWSPTALVNFNLNTGGYTHGYNSGTKTLSTSQKFGTDSNGDGELAYFDVGDAVRIITRDNGDDTLTSSQTDTIASIGTGTITLTTGISALSTASETVVILQKYNSATTSRKTGATRVSWQGDGATRIIQSNATVRLNRWS